MQYSKSRDLKPLRPRRDLKPSRPRLAKMGLAMSLETETKSRDSITDGFRENHSSELANTPIYDELLRNFDNKLITCSFISGPIKSI